MLQILNQVIKRLKFILHGRLLHMKIKTIEMVRKIRDKMSQELLKMNNKEIIEYFHKQSERIKELTGNVRQS